MFMLFILLSSYAIEGLDGVPLWTFDFIYYTCINLGAAFFK